MASRRQALRTASCLTKTTFRSVAEAEAAIEAVRERVVGFSGMNIYECRFGHHLHIGHEKKPAQHQKPRLGLASGAGIGGMNDGQENVRRSGLRKQSYVTVTRC